MKAIKIRNEVIPLTSILKLGELKSKRPFIIRDASKVDPDFPDQVYLENTLTFRYFIIHLVDGSEVTVAPRLDYGVTILRSVNELDIDKVDAESNRICSLYYNILRNFEIEIGCSFG